MAAITGAMYTDTTHADSAHGADHTAVHTALTGVATYIFTYAGSPESAQAAPVGSLCLDTTNGVAYIKKTGTGNTGWKLVTQAA